MVDSPSSDRTLPTRGISGWSVSDECDEGRGCRVGDRTSPGTSVDTGCQDPGPIRREGLPVPSEPDRPVGVGPDSGSRLSQ